MAVTQILSRAKIKDNWVQIDLSNKHSAYLIAVKNPKTAQDTIDVDKVRRIMVELAIDSGITSKPITIQYVNFDFKDKTSSEADIDIRTAFVRLIGIPSIFYVRIVAIDDGLNEYKTGETAISFNLNAVELM